jgi:hypothetical protein
LRWQVDSEIASLKRMVRNGDVPEDEPSPAPRPRTTLAHLAHAIYSDEFDAYRERYARWEQNLMWPFVRKGK